MCIRDRVYVGQSDPPTYGPKSAMNYTIGPPGLNNLCFQWFSNLHFNSDVLPVISERMLNHPTNLDVVSKN